SSGPVAITVEIKEFKFLPPKVEIPVGSAVKWVNRDAFKHTVTSGDFSGTVNQPDGRFDEELEKAQSDAAVTFSEAGTFTYYCRQHNSMNAEVLVK
ncbi:MAG: plastocyanin/azurin family copper-binding protein, partial [Acidimicrobiia bacterium]